MKLDTKNTAAYVGIECGSLAWKSNVKPFSQLATRYLVVHKAIAVYCSSSKIFSKRELTFTFAICYRPSVCRLSVVSL